MLLDAVPLETWREICRAAAKAARDGDAKARDWLTRFLMGAEPLRLVELVADDLSGHTADDDIDREDWFRTYHRSVNSPKAFLGGVPVQRPQR